MSDPLVSVKMITYNHAPYIKRAIDCILRQVIDFPIEIVIGEDCSTDGTRDIVLDYQKKFPKIIKVITSEQNVGAKLNSMRTYKACRGKYIAFCEGDDFWHNPNKLALQIKSIKNENKLVCTSYDIFHEKTGKTIHDYINYKNWKWSEGITPRDLILGTVTDLLILTCTVLIERKLCSDIIEADPYLHQSKEFLMGDTQLWIETINHTKPIFVRESCATHVITEESATRSKDAWKETRFAASQWKLKYYLSKKYKLENKFIDDFYNRLLHNQMLLSFQTNDISLAKKVKKESNYSGIDYHI